MPTHSAVVRLNLEYYRKQAKSLLKAAQSGDATAMQRLTHHSPKLPRTAKPSTTVALHDAQLTIAREQGFASWPRFKDFITQSQLNFQELVTAFIDAAVTDLHRAQEILDKHPQIANAGLYAALVLGDVKQIEEALKETPDFAKAKVGPRNWEPLLYICFSRYADGRSTRAADMTAAAQLLLRHGADPNSFAIFEQWPDMPLPVLYAAAGLNNNSSLAQSLLEAGARADDGESLYHATEHPDLACVRLLLQYGAPANQPNVLHHMLDYENLDGVRLLLSAGADPNQKNQSETALHWAVRRGRSAQVVTALLDAGVLPDVQRHDGRTAYVMAVAAGQTEVAELLKARGAKTEISELDRFLGACAVADAKEIPRLVAEAPNAIRLPENARLIADLAMHNSTATALALLAADLPVDARGEMGATALHWACWKGNAQLAKALVERGASLTIEDFQFHGTPPGWFGHGTKNCHDGVGEYAGVARVLIAAGADIPIADIPTGREDVDAILREHGLIK